MTNKIKLVCSSCQTINQFPTERLTEAPHCAQCKQGLLSDTPIAVSSDELVKHIKNSSMPLLVDFWAPWCGPCVQFAPIFTQYAAQAKYKVRLLKVDTEANQQAATQHNIRSIPTLALFKNAVEKQRMSGGLTLNHLDQWVDQNLA